MCTKLLVLLFLSSCHLSDGAVPAKIGDPDTLARLTAIEGKMLTIEKENGRLRLENKELRLDNKELNDLKSNFRKLEFRLDSEVKKSEALERRLGDSELEISVLKAFVLPADSNTSSPLRFDRKRSPNTFHITPRSTGARVAFSAHMDDHTTNIVGSEIFVFGLVNENAGGGYNKHSGVFTCPVSGTYFFTTNLLSFDGQEIFAAITINNVQKSYVDADGPPGSNGVGSNSLVIHCSKGSQVWIKHRLGTANVYGHKYTHFGGFLLWAD